MRRLPFIVGLVALSLTFSSCAYFRAAQQLRDAGGPVPYWCTSTEEIPVTAGPAVGIVDWYENVDKAPLAWDDCVTMSAQFDIAKGHAEKWPTRGAAEADGFREVTSYIPGMGTHHVRGGITPAMLREPLSFDRQNPILDNVGLDNVFDPSKPEVLQFDGNTAASKLVGFDYYVRTNTGRPPEGFPGNIDWWHHHPKICHRRTDAAMVAFNTTDSNCTSLGGVNVNYSNYYMLHVWVIDDMKFIPDVFAGQMPCITGGSAIHDPNHPCHTSRGTQSASTATLASTRTVDFTGPITSSSAGGHGMVCRMSAATAS
jgi:hypothetical protein